MATEFDNIGSLQPSAALLGTEQIEALTTALAQIGGAPNCRLTVDQIKQYVLAAAGLAAKAVTDVAGAAYTAAIADAVLWLNFTSAAAVTFTIDGGRAYPADCELEYTQSGAGAVSVVGINGAVIQSRGGLVATAGQYATAMLKRKGATNNWLLTGDIA
jgi:hypothetical protein